MDNYNFNIRIYPAAKRDLEEIVAYLNTLYPDAALRYYDLLTNKIGSLSQMPERCSFVRNAALKAKGYRFMVAESYLIFFVIKRDTVQIRRILYGKRNYEWLL